MYDIKIKNPELRRNIWLELSLNRVIIMPLILAALFFIVYLINKDNSNCTETISKFALLGFGGLVLFWGSKMASESIVDELNSRTWDAQRLTLLSPWQMAIGKLIGSTIYQWYGGMLCLSVYLSAGVSMGNFVLSLKIAFMFILAAIFVHAMTIILSLLGIKKDNNKSKINSTGFFLFSLLLAGYISSYIIPIATKSESTINWFFLTINLSDFGLFSILFFTCWSIIGLHRVMRAEFQYQNGAKTWLIFLCCLMIYLGGLTTNINDNLAIETYADLYICFAVAAFFTYILAVTESKDIVDFRKQIQLLKANQHAAFLQKAPLWVLSLGVGVILVIPLIIVGVFAQKNGIDTSLFNGNILEKMMSISVILPLTLLFFILRDIAMLLFFNFGKNPKRADFSFMLYLVVIYFVIPFIFHQSDSKTILTFFWPSEDQNIVQPFIILLEVGVAGFFVIKRFVERNKEVR